MDEHKQIVDVVRQQVGHMVRLDTVKADLLGLDRIDELWRILPVHESEVLDFIYWHKNCNRQWYETPQQAAAEYCVRWKEWHKPTAPVVDYSAGSIEYTPSSG